MNRDIPLPFRFRHFLFQIGAIQGLITKARSGYAVVKCRLLTHLEELERAQQILRNRHDCCKVLCNNRAGQSGHSDVGQKHLRRIPEDYEKHEREQKSVLVRVCSERGTDPAIAIRRKWSEQGAKTMLGAILLTLARRRR